MNITTRIEKYPSNIELYYTTDHMEHSGRVYISLDGLQDEEREDTIRDVERMAEAKTLGELQALAGEYISIVVVE